MSKSMWREHGEYVPLRDLLAVIQYSPSLRYASHRVFRFMEELVDSPEKFAPFDRAQGFAVGTVLYEDESEPGKFHFYVSHCAGHVCVYGLSFIPPQQDARSILNESLDLARKRSLIWIERCPNRWKHGNPYWA